MESDGCGSASLVLLWISRWSGDLPVVDQQVQGGVRLLWTDELPWVSRWDRDLPATGDIRLQDSGMGGGEQGRTGPGAFPRG